MTGRKRSGKNRRDIYLTWPDRATFKQSTVRSIQKDLTDQAAEKKRNRKLAGLKALGTLTGIERAKFSAQQTAAIDRFMENLISRRAALSKRLGFDCQNAGRRFGEYSCEPIESSPDRTLIHIDWTSVTLAQAQAIRTILLTYR